MDSPIALNLGQRWPEDLFSIPDRQPSFGWHFSGQSPFVVLGDPFGDLTPEVAGRTQFRLGFLKFGPLVIVEAKSSDPLWPYRTLESPRPYLLDQELPPEVTIGDTGDHMFWQMVTVSKGVIINMRAFTTSPQVTKFLRRAFAEQRAEGPISYDESDEWIWRWQQTAPTEREIWRRVEVSCLTGD